MPRDCAPNCKINVCQGPTTSALCGRAVGCLLHQVQMTQLYMTMDDVMRKNQMSFSFMAAMPAAMAIAFSLSAYWSMRRYRYTPIYRKIRGGLRVVHVIFNRSTGPTLDWFDQVLDPMESPATLFNCLQAGRVQSRSNIRYPLQPSATLHCRLHSSATV